MKLKALIFSLSLTLCTQHSSADQNAADALVVSGINFPPEVIQLIADADKPDAVLEAISLALVEIENADLLFNLVKSLLESYPSLKNQIVATAVQAVPSMRDTINDAAEASSVNLPRVYSTRATAGLQLSPLPIAGGGGGRPQIKEETTVVDTVQIDYSTPYDNTALCGGQACFDYFDNTSICGNTACREYFPNGFSDVLKVLATTTTTAPAPSTSGGGGGSAS